MEERKRPAVVDHIESGPPYKKHAASVNGGCRPHVDADMPWKDDLERFQKEAIWRQMQEHKRERADAESRLSAMTARAEYHDEHITIIDAWFSNLLDEIKLSVGHTDGHKSFEPFPSKLLGSETKLFSKHLKDRSTEISLALARLFINAAPVSPDVHNLQGRVTNLLIAEKEHIMELEKSRHEISKLQERLEDAALRYMLAEKKLDRSKSATVAKLEKQAVAGGRADASLANGQGIEDAVKTQTEDGASSEDLREAQVTAKESRAQAQKLKDQMSALESENEKLTAQLTALNNRFSRLSDEDYSKTDLFKYLKSQHEDVIKKINDLEATNIRLRDEAQKLQAERTAYRIEVENESSMAVAEREAQVAEAENNLTRIRMSRDELQADVAMRKAAQGQERNSMEQVRELAGAREDRIKALESEILRLQVQLGHNSGSVSPSTSLSGLTTEETQNKYSGLKKQYDLLNVELQSMGTAFKKASSLAAQKISGLANLEEKVQRSTAEKQKADQKYFATMKVKEAREMEVRSLRAQNAKSAEMVTSLKEAESANRALQAASDKYIAEAKESLSNVQAKLRLEQQQLVERNIQLDGLKTQVEELKKHVVAKDEMMTTKSTACRKAEVEIQSLNVQLEETKKGLETWKAKGLGNQSGEYEMLRQLAICTVCRVNFKNTTIKTCGHVFCKDCVEERTTSRMRKCPNCNRAFGAGDVMRVTL